MEPSLASEIAAYYKLKQDYDDLRSREKQRIRRDSSLTLEQKKRKLAAVVVPCPGCGKKGAASFSREGGLLIASCDSSTPCDANMRVEVGTFADVRQLAKKASAELTRLENRVIELKLGVVLGYLTADAAKEEFGTLRAEVKRTSEAVADLDARAIRVMSGAGHAQALAVARAELEEAVSQSRELGQEIDAGIHAPSIVALNVESITPLAERIRQLRYVVNRVQSSGPTATEEKILIQEPYTLASLQVLVSREPPTD